MGKFKIEKRILSALLCGGLILSTDGAVWAAPNDQAPSPKTVTVELSLEIANFYNMVPQDIQVSSDLSDQYGYVDKITDGVSILDALLVAHEQAFGDDFSPETKNDFLVVDENGFITKMAGIDTSAVGYSVNGICPNDGVLDENYGTYGGLTVNTAEIKDDDYVQFFFYDPNGYYGEIYTTFYDQDVPVRELTMKPGEEKDLYLKGYSFVYEGLNKEIKWKAVKEIPVGEINMDADSESFGGIKNDVIRTDENGMVTLKFDQTGTHYIVSKSDIDLITYVIPSVLKINVINPNTWEATAQGWQYRKENGEPAVSEFLELDGKTFYFDENGYMVTGKNTINGADYLFTEYGRMVTGWLKDGADWFYYNAEGKMAKGWLKDGANWFYFNPNGSMVTGWRSVGTKWYYFYNSGRMLTGWQFLDGHWFYLKNSGEMTKGWLKDGANWFYFNGSGYMMTGWQKIGTNWFYFYNSGRMLTGKQVINGKEYYFRPSGALAG